MRKGFEKGEAREAFQVACARRTADATLVSYQFAAHVLTEAMACPVGHGASALAEPSRPMRNA